MTKKSIFFPLSVLVALAVMVSCNRDERGLEDREIIQVNGMNYPSAAFIPGKVRVLVDENFARTVEEETDENGYVITENVKSLQGVVASLGIVRMERTFPYAGEFEERTRKEGMHLWYDIYYDEEFSLTKAGEDLSAVKGIAMVEPQPKMKHIRAEVAEESFEEIRNEAERSADLVFDDPRLSQQWHYFNDGGNSTLTEGSDINVMPVWERGVTGNENVIVSVVDGGVDWDHEDLADNMWHNPDETGDRIYGKDFVNGGMTITPDDHGTHVAGTVAAVNNNGKGVCGIAGGDAAAGVKGVKIMSCQIFIGDRSGNGAAAIKWGADHGAVISQNSWGYEYGKITYVPQSDKAAIDYFVKYAGMGSDGTQTGPMAGGIVFFAAGNDDAPEGYPGSYEACVAVASIGGDYKRAYYSNYGEWVDITAPGGDAYKGPMVLSTVPDDRYEKLQGTSMACPHMSGIAALAVSVMGGEGFTCDNLKEILLASARSLDSYNPGFVGKLGAGLIDAEQAVLGGGGEAPEPVTDLSLSVHSNFVDFELTVPKDDSGKPEKILIYYSKSEITSLSGCEYQEFSVGTLVAGDKMTGTLTDLEFNTGYYMVAIAKDFRGLTSKINNNVEITTEGNNTPYFDPDDALSISISQSEIGTADFSAVDPDGHDLSVSISPATAGISAEMLDATRGRVKVSGLETGGGTFDVKVVISDPYGEKAELDLHAVVEANHAPAVKTQIPNQLFKSLEDPAIKLNISDYFTDEDGESLNVVITASDKGVVKTSVSNGVINIAPMDFGMVTLDVKATDIVGDAATQQFKVLVREGWTDVDVMDGDVEMDLYPNPVSDFLNIRTNAPFDGKVEIFSANGSRVISQQAAFSAFDPARIDMSGVPGGVYSVVVTYTYDGVDKMIKNNIVKL